MRSIKVFLEYEDCDKYLQSAFTTFVEHDVDPKFHQLFQDNAKEIIQAIKERRQQPPSYLKEHSGNILMASTEPMLQSMDIVTTAPRLLFGLSTKDKLLIAVILDVISLVSTLLGKWTTPSDSMKRNLIETLAANPSVLTRIRQAVLELVAAKSALSKAKAVWKIFSSLREMYSVANLLKLMFSNLSWWDWIKISVTAAAQIALWIGTDGAGFIAEMALMVVNAAQLIKDAVDYVNCVDDADVQPSVFEQKHESSSFDAADLIALGHGLGSLQCEERKYYCALLRSLLDCDDRADLRGCLRSINEDNEYVGL